MWIVHLYHYLARVVDYTVTLGGTSRAGFFGLLLLPPIISAFGPVKERVRSGATWTEAISQTQWGSLFKKPVVIIWVCLIGWSFAAVTYQDHEYLVAANSRHVSQLKVATSSRSKFNGTILNSMISNDAKGRTILTLITMFINHGAPSVLLVDKMWVRFPNGRQVFGQPVMQGVGDAKLMADRSTETPDIRLRHEDYFPNKALDRPIPTGGDVTGWTMDMFPGITRKELLNRNTEVFFQCLDANNNLVIAHKLVNQP